MISVKSRVWFSLLTFVLVSVLNTQHKWVTKCTLRFFFFLFEDIFTVIMKRLQGVALNENALIIHTCCTPHFR